MRLSLTEKLLIVLIFVPDSDDFVAELQKKPLIYKGLIFSASRYKGLESAVICPAK